MQVYEVWSKAGSRTEYELTVSVSSDRIPERGSTVEIPDVGKVDVLSSLVLLKGDRKPPDGEVIVRLDVVAEPR
jgi:hypothetical protein